MKNLIILTLVMTSSFLFSQNCPDTYGAGSDIAAAIADLAGIGDCYGDNYYACRKAQLKLYQAEAKLGNAVNNSLVDNCIPCNLAPLGVLAAQINGIYGSIYNMGYSSYHTTLEGTIEQWMDPAYRCSEVVRDPTNGPNITGTWVSDQNGFIEITLDKIRNKYKFRMYSDKNPQEYVTYAVYTSTYEIFAESWGAAGSVYDDAIIWSSQKWTRQAKSDSIDVGSKKGGYYLIEVSGSGYGKVSSAQVVRITGFP